MSIAKFGQPVRDLPAADRLPADITDLVTAWRTAIDALTDLELEHAQALIALAAAPEADRLADVEAIEAGDDLPPEHSHERAAQARVADAERRWPVIQTKASRAGNELKTALLDHYNEFAAAQQAAAQQALDAYDNTITEASKMISDAARMLATETRWLLETVELPMIGSGELGAQPANIGTPTIVDHTRQPFAQLLDRAAEAIRIHNLPDAPPAKKRGARRIR